MRDSGAFIVNTMHCGGGGGGGGGGSILYGVRYFSSVLARTAVYLSSGMDI